MKNYPRILSQLPPTDVCNEVAPVVLYNVDQSEKVIIPNHDELNNLNKPNQHPIEVIVGLQEELSRLDNKEVIVEEVDPTVPDWAKQENKPEYTFDEVGALSKDTRLSDLPQDDKHLTVSEEEKERWNREISYEELTNKPIIPTKLAELEQDNQHLTVTFSEKLQWNSGTGNGGGFSGNYNDLLNKPFIPTQLAELITDEEHQTVTAAEKEYWNSLGNNNNNFSGDYNDLINKPIIPSTLSELRQNDEYQTVSAEDKENWNTKLSSQQNVEDAGKIFTIDIDGKTKFSSLSELFSGITWGMLAGKS